MKYSKYISLISAIGDLLIMNICFNFWYWYLLEFDFASFTTNSILFFFFINIAWIITANIFEAYKIEHHSYKKVILFNNTKAIIIFFFLFLLYFQVLTFDYYSRTEIKYLFVIFFSILLFWKFSLYYLFLFYRKLGFNYRNTIIIGYSDKATELRDYFIKNTWTGYRFKGFFTHNKSDKKDIVGTYNDIEKYVVDNSIDELYIMSDNVHYSIYKIITSISSKHPVLIRLVPDLSSFSYNNIELVEYDMIPIMKIKPGPLSLWHNRAIKRFMDIFMSTFVILTILSWLVPILFIIDLCSGLEGVFFTQKRSGIDNKPFNLIKFRTMRHNNDAHTKSATKNDVRITKVGKFLRTTSIDELPQFFNVLIGNMSVIGPRPHMLKHTDEYKALINKFMIRQAIKPGITGYAQVRGFRGEIKKTKDMKERVKLDIFYIENWSLMLDVKIIFLTIKNLLKGDVKAY